MSFALPTVLALTQHRSPRNERLTDDASPDVSPSLQARLVEALLGDALLTLEDLPAGWSAVTPPDDSLFAATQLRSLLLAELKVAFTDPSTGAVVHHEVGVLPRWTLRHLLDEGSERAGTAAPQRVTSVIASHDAAVAVAVAPAAGEDAATFRRGSIVMALQCDARIAPDVVASIEAAAHAKCEQIAEALR